MSSGATAHEKWQRRTRHIAFGQCAVAIAGLVLLVGLLHLEEGLAYAYGVGVILANTLWLASKVTKAAGSGSDAGDIKRRLYRSAAGRFVLLIVLLVAAHGLGLPLPWVVAGMVAGQLVFFVMGAWGLMSPMSTTGGER